MSLIPLRYAETTEAAMGSRTTSPSTAVAVPSPPVASESPTSSSREGGSYAKR